MSKNGTNNSCLEDLRHVATASQILNHLTGGPGKAGRLACSKLLEYESVMESSPEALYYGVKIIEAQDCKNIGELAVKYFFEEFNEREDLDYIKIKEMKQAIHIARFAKQNDMST
jgi:hypothetical protein